jgi:hypothetical protein
LPIINTMAKRNTSSRVAAKKKVVVEKPLATEVTLCVAATPATRRAAANSPETPRAVVGAASMVLTTRSSLHSKKMPAYLGDFTHFPAHPSGDLAQANPSNGEEGSIHPDANHGVAVANPNQSMTCTSDLGVEQGTADGDEDAGGDQFINSDDELDVEKSESVHCM